MVGRRPANHFRVLASLLYARFTWAERHPDGALTANSAQFARALGLRTAKLHAALAHLRELGLLDRLVWHQTWFLARVLPPQGWSRAVPGPNTPLDPQNPFLEPVWQGPIGGLPLTLDVDPAPRACPEDPT